MNDQKTWFTNYSVFWHSGKFSNSIEIYKLQIDSISHISSLFWPQNMVEDGFKCFKVTRTVLSNPRPRLRHASNGIFSFSNSLKTHRKWFWMISKFYPITIHCRNFLYLEKNKIENNDLKNNFFTYKCVRTQCTFIPSMLKVEYTLSSIPT